MIDRSEILGVAGELSLSPDVIEKDYVLGWLLAGIYAHADLATTWTFKGGTCLKKCYFETYRFSEDLDFTISDAAHIDATFLGEAFRDVARWIYDETGIEIPVEQLRFEVLRNPRGGLSCEGRVYYNGPLRRVGSIPRIKLDLTSDEVLVLTPTERPVGHPYSDLPEGGILARCYAYEELFAEKIRALAERTRPRDLYDVINLFRHGEFRPAVAAVADVLRRKCEFKGIPFPRLATLTGTTEELRADWRAMLGHQLPVLPPFESFWDALPEFFSWLAGAAAPRLAPDPLPAGVQVLRPAVGSLRRQGIVGASYLESIRFAGANRLCVSLDYVNERGERNVRTIAPYSLRRTAAGEIIVRAIRVDNDEPRSYRLDRIRGVSVTDRTLVPRYEVEFSATELGAIPPVSSGRLTQSFASPRRLGRSPGRPGSRLRTGPTYVYECLACRKRFRRSRQDSKLGPHKRRDGWDCYGRTGYLVETKY